MNERKKVRWIEDLKKLSREQVLEYAKTYCITSTNLGWDFVPGHADGACVFDKNGKMFIDFSAGIGSLNVGHNHPKVLNSIRYVLDKKLAGKPSHQWPCDVSTLLAKKLCDITPGSFAKKVFFAVGGSAAVERAMKLCLNRMKADQTFFTFFDAFHGRGLGALRLHQSKELHRKKFIEESRRAFALEFPKLHHNCARYRSAIVAPNAWWRSQKPGAFFFECVQGEGGVNVGCFTCLPEVINEFRKFGAIIVADEIQTGLMRTGEMFACNWYGIEPDIIILAKSLCPGGNLSAYVSKADLDYEERARDSLTGVFARDCAAALGTIEALEDEGDIKHKINILTTVAPHGLGMMRKIDFQLPQIRDAFIKRAWQNEPVGLITLGTGEKSLRIMPPVIISPDVLDLGVYVLKNLLAFKTP